MQLPPIDNSSRGFFESVLWLVAGALVLWYLIALGIFELATT